MAIQKKILVVDDDLLIRSVVKRDLEGQEFAIEVAADGLQGWQMVEHFSPDLVITDLNMPGMGGLELLEKIREDHRFKHLPVLCITGEENLELKQIAIGLGATGWVQKPFNPVTWGGTLKKLLS